MLEDRAKAYKIGYHKQQIEAGNYSLERASNDGERAFFELAIQHHTSEMENESLQEVLTVFNEYKVEVQEVLYQSGMNLMEDLEVLTS